MKLSDNQKLLLKDFINSDIFQTKSIENYSEYWNQYASSINTTLGKNNNIISFGGTGGSALYESKLTKLKNLLFNTKALFDIKFIFKKINFKRKKFLNSLRIKYLSWEDGFNAVMSSNEIVSYSDSKYFVNHDHLRNYKSVFKSSKEVIKDYKKWGPMPIYGKMFIHYYNFNLLQPFILEKERQNFMEIGGGNGLFASILSRKYKPQNYIMIDLPETLVNTYCYLSNCSEEYKIYLPNLFKTKESLMKVLNNNDNHSTNFIFLTPNQKDIIPENFVDFSANMSSFQEMDLRHIKEYFSLIKKVSKKDALFYCANRIQKQSHGESGIECKSKPNMFYEYPWDNEDERLIDEVNRLHNSCSKEPTAIRLVKINKK